MSETEPVLEPIPVTKDLPVVNGKENYDIHDLKSEYANGLQETDMDHENKTGLNGDIDSDEVEVNGDNEAEHRVNGGMEDEDSIGGDELPPPPELVPELPPPPAETGVEKREGEAEETDEVPAELINDEPVDETAMDEVIESSVDPEVVDDQCMDDNDELMNVSDNDEANARQSLEPPQRLTDYLSEEELVSDGGLEDEHEKPTEQECEETQEQLIDFGETKHESDADEPGLEPEVEETVHQEDPVPGDEPVEVVHEAPVVEEPTSDTEEPTEAKQQHMSYSEPAIVIDNKPAEEDEEETPPPPPPPLVNETPPPPPPLDDSVPLKRVSGGSTPSKESNQSLESPTPPSQSVAVVPPQPEIKPVVKPSPELERKEPEQEPQAAPPAQPAPSVQPVAIVTQPVAIVIPQVKSDEEASPPGSPSTSSSADRPETEQPDQLSSPQVSQKINKKNFKNKIKFGMDLVEGSLKHLHFLKTVNNNPGLYEEWLFKKAIRRYEAFWLPLAAEHKKECLAAPLDIEWIWHCHMLSPVTYEKDCKTQVGLLVEHKVMSEKDRTKALEKSRKYWTAKYPKEPFEIELVYKESVIEEEIPVALGDEVVAEKKADGETEEVKTEEKTEETVEKDNNVAVAEAKAGQTDKSLTDGAVQPSTSEQAPAVTEQPEPEQAMEAKLTKEPSEPKIPEEGYEQRSSYHIFAAICRQRVFYYQTSLAHYHDKTFLKAAQKRYQRFLFLKHQNPSEMLVPCYDIDLMWHTHMLQPSAYKHDTTKVLGQTLFHDDSVNNRAAGSALVRADNRTRDLWKELFNDSFTTFGGMFRGDPPILCERMSLIEPVETYTFSTKKATINLDKVQIEGLPEEVNKYSVKLAIGTNERDGPVIKQLKGNKKKIEFENTKKGLAHFLFDTKEYDRIKFNMTSQVGFACTGHDEDIGQQMFHLMPVVEGIPMNQSEPSNLTDTVTIDYEHNLKATFTASIEPPKQGPTMLFLVPGNYETRFCIMPEQVVQMWGPVPLPRLPAGADNHCIIASHKFINHTGEVTFSCRVIHSLPLLMSAVQVLFQGRMTAVAHLIGSDQIPLPTQLSDSKKIFSLNPGDDQRGIVIKNQTGDWGLIRGQWTGFRKHQPAVAATKGKKAKKEVPWCPGTLSVSFFKCSTGAWQHLTLPYQQENYRFNIQDASVDLRTGTIEIDSESNEVAENLATAFSVALLHVLLQPRYQPPPPPEPVPVTVEAPPPYTAPSVVEEKEKPGEEKQAEEKEEGNVEKEQGDDQDVQEGEGAKADAAEAAEEKPQVAEEKVQEPSTPKTPKSPARSEPPPTPSKKVKEIPPIPTFDLGLVIAAGFCVETATNEHIKKQYGENACAGCVAVGMDVGIGHIGEAVEIEVADIADAGEAVDGADINGDGNEALETGGEVANQDVAMETGAMDGIGGDAGAAACGAF